MYKNKIIEYCSNNNDLFSQNDTITFGLSYQYNKRIRCSYIGNIDSTKKADIINNFNSSVFTNNDNIDGAFKYCIKISGKLIKCSNQISFDDIGFNIGPIMTGGRSRAAIMRTIMQDVLRKMKDTYNIYLKTHPGLKGRITIEYTINQDGIVVYARVIKSSIDNYEMNKNELEIISKASFGKINHDYDWTTVVYPFVFSY
jgi:hypothetical protein